MRYYFITTDKGEFNRRVDHFIARGITLPTTQFVYVDGVETLQGVTKQGEVLFAGNWAQRKDARDLIRRLQGQGMKLGANLLEEVGL